jgi:acetyl-CoA carboxylase carboxyltransferase component
LIPDNPNKPYDMKELVEKVVDDGEFFELQPDYAKNIIVGFARMDGQVVGIVANQPLVLAGVSRYQEQSCKAARFVRFCDAFSIPDHHLRRRTGLHAGYRARNTVESSSTARNCCTPTPNATVPKITVITRKAYGGAYDVMASKHLRGDVNFAWPTCGDRGDGREGRGRDHLPRRKKRSGQTRRPRSRVQTKIRQSVHRVVAWLRRRRDHAARHTATSLSCADAAAR